MKRNMRDNPLHEQIRNERNSLEWEIKTLQFAISLAVPLGYEDKIERLKWELDQAMQKLQVVPH